MIVLRELNIVTVGKIFNGITKRKILMLNDETEDVPSACTSEAVIELIFGIHLERRSLLLVKRAQSDMTVSRAAQRDHPANHLDNVHCLL